MDSINVRTLSQRKALCRQLKPLRTFTLACAALLVTAAASFAAELTFTLDPAESEVSLFGRIVLLNADMGQQDAGSDLTSYSGTIVLDVDDPFAPSTIQFLGGSAVAAISGNWLPEVGGGSPGRPLIRGDADPGRAQPANYGLDASGLLIGSLWIAFRDLDLSPLSQSLSVADGLFAADQTLTIQAGSADYTASSLLYGDMNGHVDLVGKMAENVAETTATYSVANGRATLQLPIELVVPVEDEAGTPLLELTFTGSVTANAILSPPPDADFDMDGDVDGDDLLDMLLGFGTQSGATPEQGDADLDGDVDRADLGVWREQSGRGVGPLAAAAVPEPNSLVLLGLLGLGWTAWTRRSKRAE